MRSGFWLNPAAAGALAVRLLPSDSTGGVPASGLQAQGPGAGAAPSAQAQGPGAEGAAPAPGPAWIGLGSGGARGAARHTPGSAASASGFAAEADATDVVLGLRLAHGRVCLLVPLPPPVRLPIPGGVGIGVRDLKAMICARKRSVS